MRIHHFLGAILTFGVVLVPTWGQFPGGGRPSGFGGGSPGGFGGPGGFMSMDVNQKFDMYARGRPFFLISDTRMLRDSLTQWAKENNITNGQITRDQFVAFNKKVSDGSIKISMNGFGGMGGPGMSSPVTGGPGTTPGSMGGKFPGFGPPGGGAPSGQTTSGQPMGNPIELLNQMAESEFKRRDDNGDGQLNRDEMSSSLRNDLDRWDTNRDNLIDLTEFKAYFTFRMQRGDRDNPPNPVTVIIEEELDARPVVYRAGKLPKEMPKWFGELDVDKDGQVSLFEWRTGNRDMEDFRSYDRNDDGLISPEETLRYVAQNGNAAPKTSTSSTPSLTGAPVGGGEGSGGDRGSFFSKFKKR